MKKAIFRSSVNFCKLTKSRYKERGSHFVLVSKFQRGRDVRLLSASLGPDSVLEH